jgi:hypothetical protein
MQEIPERVVLSAAAVTASEISECPRERVGPGEAGSVALRAGARREPVANVAHPAWVHAAAVEAVAVAEEGSTAVTKGKQMRSRKPNSLVRNAGIGLWMFGIFCALTGFAYTSSQSDQKAPETQHSTQKAFDTPQQAADALIQAAAPYNVAALTQILGPEGIDLVSSEDPVNDKNIAAAFAKKAHEKQAVTIDPKLPARAILVVGNDAWPLPIPMVQKNGKWRFDTKAGREEILFRRIGRNELDAIQLCHGYVEAQYEYASQKHDGAEANQYAQRVISTPGKHDGLVWRTSDGKLEGPVSEGIAKALQQGYPEHSQPYHGYYFKILKGQGSDAPLGQMDFVVKGAMIGGFALAAAPAQYRVTGVKTFIVSYEGIVYQKDLGPDTLKVFNSMELYNPDSTWKRTEDMWPSEVADSTQ